MTIAELRRQLATTEWPIVLCVNRTEIQVGFREDLMVPSAGNLVCVYQEGAFEVIDARHIAMLRRLKPRSRAS